MKLLILIASIVFAGCATNPPTEPVSKITPVQEIVTRNSNILIDPRILEPCKPLVLLNGLDHKDILLNVQDNVIIYKECSDKHSSVVKVLKQISDKDRPND